MSCSIASPWPPTASTVAQGFTAKAITGRSRPDFEATAAGSDAMTEIGVVGSPTVADASMAMSTSGFFARPGSPLRSRSPPSIHAATSRSFPSGIFGASGGIGDSLPMCAMAR